MSDMLRSNVTKNTCRYCGKRVRGRTDKKFCDDSCRNRYHYDRRKAERSKIRQINYRLSRNRRIIEDLLQEGVTMIHRDELLRLGFDFGYYTHIHQDESELLYKACYNVGYRSIAPNLYQCIPLNHKAKNETP